MKKKPPGETIHHSDLSEITGYDEKRFRQLAADGWFPAAVRGVYKTVPTLAGIVRFLKGVTAEKSQFSRNKIGIDEKRAAGVDLDNRRKTREESVALGQLLTLDEWKTLTSETLPPMGQVVTTILETEMPSQCTGKSEAQLRVWGKKANAKFRARLEKAGEKFVPEKVVGHRKIKLEIDTD